MNVDPLTYISLFSGGGGLDLGFRRAVPGAQCVAFVEHEASAAALLADHAEAGSLDDAPVFTDAFAFPAAEFHGLVDWVIGGPPCQPFSVAGKRRGADDPRDLWPLTLRVVGQVQPRGCFFENVPSADSLWHVYENVIPGLQYLGYEVAAGIFSAAEVGAPHQRERLFILAVADGGCEQINLQQRPAGRELAGGGAELGHADKPGLAQRERNGGVGHGKVTGHPRPFAWPPGPTDTDAWAAVLRERPDLAPALADTGHVSRRVPQTGGSNGASGGTVASSGQNSIKADGQDAAQPEVRRMADGLAVRLDGLSRLQRLRILGNGVIPATAAKAFSTLRDELLADSPGGAG